MTGVSLNWMIENLEHFDYGFPARGENDNECETVKFDEWLGGDQCIKVEQNYLAGTEPAESSNVGYNAAFKDLKRPINDYVLHDDNGDHIRLEIHESVVDRISMGCEHYGYDSRWYLEAPLDKCFETKEGGGYEFNR